MKYTKDYGGFVNEGTWSYGSVSSMVKLAQELEKMAKKADDADDLLGQLESLDKKMSTIAGDDGVFDEYDTAKANAEAKDLEGAKTATYATAKAIRNLTVQIHESEEVDVLEAISKSERKEMVDYIVSMEDEIPESLWDAISDEIGTSDWSIGIKKLKDDQVQSIYNDMIDARANESSNNVDEKLVKPARGHNYYVLSKDVPVKYIVSQSNPTGATGVLLHNKKGYIDGKKGAYIIDYFGGHYYVDMENQFASYIYKLKDQDRGFRDALEEVDEAPQHADWREFMREIPFENNMKHLKGYDGFLNEANFDAKKFRKEAEAIPFEEWVVDWEHGETDGYYYVAAEWKGKYYLQWGAVVSPGEDLEDIDFSEEGEYITKKEYENIAY